MTQSTTTSEGSLLLTLEEISGLVSHSHDPGETLGNIVRLIQRRFQTDVCSVYVMEPDRGELVLGATVGLKSDSVGQVRMRLDEGLTGLVARQLAPVMVHDAFQHPRFKFFPEAGEDPYHSFLGVPLVERGLVQGVMVVQTSEPRTFSASEIRMLVTVGSQVAPIVAEAKLLEDVLAAVHPPNAGASIVEPANSRAQTRELTGVPLSPGVGVGRAYIMNGFDEWRGKLSGRSTDPDVESQRLRTATDAALDEITRLSQRISDLVGEDHGAILQAQLLILQDRKIQRDLADRIQAGATAESALLLTLDQYVAAFQKIANTFFRERVYDVKDVFRRVLWHLHTLSQVDTAIGDSSTLEGNALAASPPGSPEVGGARIVLLAHEVSVMDLFSVDLNRLSAVVVEHGGPQSHAAILARSLGVPMVGQARHFLQGTEPGCPLLVDGSKGTIHLHPTAERLSACTSFIASLSASSIAGSPLPGDGPTCVEAIDSGRMPLVQANINLLSEVGPAVEQGAEGVGLYRTEFLFLARRTLPTEEEQVGIYKKLLHRLGGRPASIRTFDLRPDKIAHCAHLTSTATGPLDWRLVLESVPIQKLFHSQIRAILRAATAGPARILVPLVTCTEQLDFVLSTVDQARYELHNEGLEYDPEVQLGIMVEVAAAAMLIDIWAEHVDYFALGTNDLVASALGIDRDDPVVAGLTDTLHPGLLRTIREVVRVTRQTQRPVTVCGEMAADPDGVLALAILGVNAVSVPVPHLAAIRSVLRNSSIHDLEGLNSKLLQARTAADARRLLRDVAALDYVTRS